MISSPACHGPPSKEGEEWPAPMKIADDIDTVSFASNVSEVLTPSDEQTKLPGLEIIVTVRLSVWDTAIVAFSEKICKSSKLQTN